MTGGDRQTVMGECKGEVKFGLVELYYGDTLCGETGEERLGTVEDSF